MLDGEQPHQRRDHGDDLVAEEGAHGEADDAVQRHGDECRCAHLPCLGAESDVAATGTDQRDADGERDDERRPGEDEAGEDQATPFATRIRYRRGSTRNVAVPLVGATSPSSIRNVVVSPAPLGPANNVTCPAPITAVTPSTVRWVMRFDPEAAYDYATGQR